MQFDYELRTKKPFCKVEPTIKDCVRIQLDCMEAEIDLTISREALRRLALVATLFLRNGDGAFIMEGGHLLRITKDGNIPAPKDQRDFASSLAR